MAGPAPAAICDPPRSAVDVSVPTAIVGDGSPASCDESTLRTALTAGGVVVFDCGAEPVTITLSSQLDITADTVIDGGGIVTLSGGDATRILSIDTNFELSSPTLTVQNLTFRNGRASGTPIKLGTELDGGGGAIYHYGGTVVALDSFFLDNHCAQEGPDVAGGAIYGVGLGETIVVGSYFAGNSGSNGGAIGGLGTSITIVNSVLLDNRATGCRANWADDSGVQHGRGGNGGAILMDGRGRSLTICGSLVQGNVGRAHGGAVMRTSYESEPTVIDRSWLDGNSIEDPSGDWVSASGGGVYLQGSAVTISSTTISNNMAPQFAGLWVLSHGPAQGSLSATNVTISGNATYPREDFTKRGIGGGLIMEQDAIGTLVNCTIANNSAQFASGIVNASPLTIRNTIISNNADNQYTPLNCNGSDFDTPPGAGENNLQWPNGLMDDMDCTVGIQRVDPQLGPLQDNGGLHPTMLPQPTSPAIAAGSNCPATDQHGNPRQASCTIGAVYVDPP